VFSKSVVVEVVRRDGRREVVVVGDVEPEVESGFEGGGDLGTLWLVRILGSVFANVARGAGVDVSFTDYGGAGRSQGFVGDVGGSFFGSGCGDRIHAIGFGSSDVPPSESDYRLLGEFARVDSSFTVDETGYAVSHSVMYTADVARVVCEVGLYLRVCDSDNALRTILFDRTVLSPCVSLNPGDTIGVAYVFRV